jgi:16S rRNA (cytosine967-C5)-methyltransferase
MNKNARHVACEILMRIEREQSYADRLIDEELSSGRLQGPDRGLLTELVFGVLRRRGTLDFLIDAFSDRKVERLERPVAALLRLGLYQAFFLDRVPVSAAVNETVKLAKVFAPRAAGFVNAVLRRADRERESVPWPDRNADLASYLAARHSLPRWLSVQWVEQLGAAEAEALACAMSEPPPLTLRANTLKTTREGLLSLFAAEGLPAHPGDYSPTAVTVMSRVRPTSLPGFPEGLFTVQDESSQLAVSFLSPLPGQRVLDLCAAPGGKATHIAQLLENRGTLLACDRDGRKLRRIGETAERLGLTTIETRELDASSPDAPLARTSFDRVLVDAPCTGLGVIRRNPEAKWRLIPEDQGRLARTQRAILGTAADCLADDGILIYSTCSTSVEENEGVVDDFLSARGDFMVENLRDLFPRFADLFTDRGFFRSWPHRHTMDGFFAARLRKKR